MKTANKSFIDIPFAINISMTRHCFDNTSCCDVHQKHIVRSKHMYICTIIELLVLCGRAASDRLS